jgi:hypothetical protein
VREQAYVLTPGRYVGLPDEEHLNALIEEKLKKIKLG